MEVLRTLSSTRAGFEPIPVKEMYCHVILDKRSEVNMHEPSDRLTIDSFGSDALCSRDCSKTHSRPKVLSKQQ